MLIGPRLRATLLTAFALSLVSSRALADEASCKEGFEQADLLLKSTTGEVRLLEARERLRACANPSCKSWMVSDCTKSLAVLEQRLPSVVFFARTERGDELLDVKVEAGGEWLAERLDGRAIETDPGPRTFRFVLPSGEAYEVKAVVAEGVKAQAVTLRVSARPTTANPALAAAPITTAPEASGSGSSLRTTSYLLGGAGLAGLALGTYFGLRAISQKSDAKCDAAAECEDGDALAKARSSAMMSNVAFVAGGVLTASGVALFVLSTPDSSVRASMAPAVSQQAMGMTMTGAW
ncbi:hypothetical protein AKJ09_11047 [Labilithrix luteola]|uniref:Transmembrane protein n=1 Tax=Labilithrix luteola TaxID=1391654 RepID=A0A0K1QF41_9BACT|nr:hypothetical protein [Labilithrix luteola]AKV04384.1 hypothetical protein AKJ09_11047 [Labilithrix luteola]